MPKISGLTAAGAIACTAIAFAPSLQAKVANPDLVPAKAALTISIPDAAGLLQAANANSLMSAANNQLVPFIKEKLEEEGATEKLASLEKVLGFELTPTNVIGTFSSLDAYVVAGASQDDTVVGAIVGVADKKRADQIISLASMAVSEAVSGESEEKKKPTETKYKDLTITHYGEEGTGVYVVRTEQSLLISNKQDEVKALVDRLKDKSSDALGSFADYKTVSDRLASENGNIFFYSNPEALNSLIQSAGAESNPFAEITKKLQVVKFQGGVVKLDPKAILSLSAGVLSSGGLSDFFKSNPGKEIDSINFATADNLFFLGTSMLDSKAIAEGIQEISGSIPGADEAKAQIDSAEQTLGFSLEKDLIPAVGNEFAILVNKVDLDSGPMPSVDGAIIVKVGEEAKMKKIIESLEKLGAGMAPNGFESSKIGGADVKFVPVPLPGVQPGFSIHNGYLIIGTTKAGIGSVIDAKGGKSNLSGSAAFKKLSPRVTSSGQSVTYLNLGAIADLGLKVAKDRVGDDKDAEAILTKVTAVVKTLGSLGASQSVKDGLLISDSVLNLN